jgi:hypothetical protein
MSILARSTPYRTRPYDTYTCERCGIQRNNRSNPKPTHCPDCRPYTKDTP